MMKELHITSQQELDNIPEDFCGTIFIEFGTSLSPAKLNKRYAHAMVYVPATASVYVLGDAIVSAAGAATVSASDNARVYAYGDATVYAYGDAIVSVSGHARVYAYDHTTVSASENATVSASGHASVYASGNARIYASGNVSVSANNNARVDASENVQICNYQINDSKIKIEGNSRIVYLPRNIEEFISLYNIKKNGDILTFYKAVHKKGNEYISNYSSSFRYVIGEEKIENADLTPACCGNGIHISSLNFALNFGVVWNDLAILELEVNINDIVFIKNSDGELRASKVKVIREVPLEECGILGEMILRSEEEWQ